MAWLEYAGALVQSIDAIGQTVHHATDNQNKSFTRADYRKYNTTKMPTGAIVPYGYGRRTTSGYGVRSRYAKRRSRAYFQQPAFRSGKYRRVGNYGKFENVHPYRLSMGLNEKKFFDTIIDFAPGISATGENSISFNLIPGGADPEERVGRKIRVFSMHVRGNITVASASDATPACVDHIRLVYVQDKQCNGTVPAVTELLETADINSFLKLENSGRFRILKEINHAVAHSTSCGNGSANDHGENSYPFKFTLTWKDPLIIEWGGITGTISTVKSNNLYCMMISEGAIATMGMNSCVRLRYTD